MKLMKQVGQQNDIKTFMPISNIHLRFCSNKQVLRHTLSVIEIASVERAELGERIRQVAEEYKHKRQAGSVGRGGQSSDNNKMIVEAVGKGILKRALIRSYYCRNCAIRIHS